MKLQNLTVIFIIIVLPLVLILSYYISLQIDTSNMQTSYNTKLLDATKEAMEAFEINTVEWNEAYSETGDSKRRDVMASINTFTNSLANSLGVGGATKDYVLPYVPAILFTMHDGYYIYSPSETKTVIKDENGVGVVMSEKLLNEGVIEEYSESKLENDQGKILYQLDTSKGSADGTYNGTEFTLDAGKAQVEYSHILKPFNSYSAKYGDITINYTLDNYITVYGDTGGESYIKSGYLIDTNPDNLNIDERDKLNTIEVKINNKYVTIGPETLTENVYIKGEGVKNYHYVYEAVNNTKVYFDGDTPFQVSSTGESTNLEKTTTVMYKKISILSSENENKYFEIFQALNDGESTNANGSTRTIEKGQWYLGTELSSGDIRITDEAGDYGQENYSLTTDFSAMNYYVESYAFTKWVEEKLGGIQAENIKQTIEDSDVEGAEEQEQTFTVSGPIFNGYYEGEDSVFQLHKKEVMRNLLINNLNQAITSYAGTSTETEYKLPVLQETDWDQILNNVSITAFVQGIPIGMKYYNNYAVATSTNNKEYVNPDGIYLTGSNEDEYYHTYGCDKIKGDTLIGYRSADYIVRSYEEGEEPNTTTSYYSKHPDHTQLCYYCLVDRNQMEKAKEGSDLEKQEDTAYLTALARERYNAGKTRLETVEAYVPPEPEPEPEPEVYMQIIPYNEDEQITKMDKNNVKYVTTTNAIDKGEDQYAFARITVDTLGDFDYYQYQYRINNGEWINVTEKEVDTTSWTGEGEYKIQLRALRNGEIVSTITKIIVIDNTGPKITNVTIKQDGTILGFPKYYRYATVEDKYTELKGKPKIKFDTNIFNDMDLVGDNQYRKYLVGLLDHSYCTITATDELGNTTTGTFN